MKNGLYRHTVLDSIELLGQLLLYLSIHLSCSVTAIWKIVLVAGRVRQFLRRSDWFFVMLLCRCCYVDDVLF